MLAISKVAWDCGIRLKSTPLFESVNGEGKVKSNPGNWENELPNPFAKKEDDLTGEWNLSK